MLDQTQFSEEIVQTASQEALDIVVLYRDDADLGRQPRPWVQLSTRLNWRDIGQALRAEVLERVGICTCAQCRRPTSKREYRENYWVAVVCLAEDGDPSGLVKHLNSRRVLTQFDRKVLAGLLDLVFKKGEPASNRGRPKNIAAQGCARMASKLYEHWKAINRLYRIKDWGHSDEMKDEACRLAIDHREAERARFRGASTNPNHPLSKATPDFERVRDLMERPKLRYR
jgi:hypothetical protein